MTLQLTEARADTGRNRLDLAVENLLGQQSAEGWWKGELETNVTIDAEDLFLRHFLGVLGSRESEPTARWIRHKQRGDGSWATFHDGPADVSTTVEAYVGLRLAGDDPGAEHMAAARRTILELGGLERARVFTKIWLALLGMWDWNHVPVLPPELIFLPRWAPLNIYDFACWARQTIVPLTIVSAHRPVRRAGFTVDELRAGGPPMPPPDGGWEHAFVAIDRLLGRYGRHPVRRLRAAALDRAEQWIIERQEADGSWGGIQPPWVYSLIALALRGYDLDHPAMRRGLDGLDGFTVHEDGFRRIEACQSPVWDTGLAVIALLDAGVPAGDPALRRAGAWLAGEEIGVRGDWAVRRPHLQPSGWAFEFANDNYPDIDDTAVIALALQRLDPGDGAPPPIVRRGAAWAAGRRSATSARSSIPRAPTSPRTSSSSWPASPATGTRCARARAGCSASRSLTAPGSAAGARTSSTAPARRCRPSARPASAATTRRCETASASSSRPRTRTAAGARTCAATATRPGAPAARRLRPRPPGR